MGPDEVADFINCTKIDEESVSCNGSVYNLPEKILTYHDTEFWIYIGIYTGLVLLAGLMSGLTMGLLSLDTTTLTVLRDGGTDKERKYAKRILPLVSRHHLLLVTLLLANAVAVEAMPIFLDRVSDPIIAIVVSVTAVLLFGEVIPQAICTRYGLAIGAVLSPFVYMLMGLLFIIAWPLSKLLDCILGEDHGTFYRRGQLKVLVDMHGPNIGQENGEHDKDEQLTIDEVLIIKGALDMKTKTASTAMIPISDVYMVSLEAKLDLETMTHIMTQGHSRIPVYAGDRSNVIGLLLTKTLIKLNPADATPVTQVLQFSAYARPAMFIDADMPLFDLLNQFQTGKSHLAVVRKKTRQPPTGASGDGDYRHDDTKPLLTIQDEPYEDGDYRHDDTKPLLTIQDEPYEDDVRHDDTKPLLTIQDEPYEDDIPEIVGIITLEDVIEELLQEEINDEIDMQKMQETSRLLQVAMAKAAHTRKNQLHRCTSQPKGIGSSSEPDSTVRRELSSSQPDESSVPIDLGGATSAAPDPPLVTFD